MKIKQLVACLACFFVTGGVWADGAQPPVAAGSPLSSLVMFGVIFLAMYWFMIRPQNKKAKEHRDLLSRLQKGDEIVTNSGILGKISKVSDQFFTITISEGVEITVQKQAIAGSLPKGTLKSI